ncbi:hypothetical protein DFJ74DRAFT_705060 [Hyaloraphidium curvatum]|nr:hypothetical protein DFJ74DRAFT_705060 [Hyaloraphidium curvatum]
MLASRLASRPLLLRPPPCLAALRPPPSPLARATHPLPNLLPRSFASQPGPPPDPLTTAILRLPRPLRLFAAVSGGFSAFLLLKPHIWTPLALAGGWYAYRLLRHALVLNPPTMRTLMGNPARYRAQMEAFEREFGLEGARRMERMLRETGAMPTFPGAGKLDLPKLAADLAKLGAAELASRAAADADLAARLAHLGKRDKWAVVSEPRDVASSSVSSFVFLNGTPRSGGVTRVGATFDVGSRTGKVAVRAEARVEGGSVVLESLTIDDGRGAFAVPPDGAAAGARKPPPPGVIDVTWKEVKK